MYYAHHWDLLRTIDVDSWKLIKRDIGRVMQAAQIQVAGGDGTRATRVEFSDDRIIFNGLGEDACEPFILERTASPFESCRTDRKPYDLLVTAALLIARRYVGAHWLRIESEGRSFDWVPAVRLCNRIFLREPLERIGA